MSTMIESEQGYDIALVRIEGLMNNTEPGSPEHDELESLIIKVQAYEELRYPIPEHPPGEA